VCVCVYTVIEMNKMLQPSTLRVASDNRLDLIYTLKKSRLKIHSIFSNKRKTNNKLMKNETFYINPIFFKIDFIF